MGRERQRSGHNRGLTAHRHLGEGRRAVRLADRDGERGDCDEGHDEDRGDAAPRAAFRSLGARRKIDASRRVRVGLRAAPLRAGVRRKGETTLIVYQTKLELCRETRVDLHRRPHSHVAVMSDLMRLESLPWGREHVSKVSITPRRLGGRRRGDRAANVTDCRSVSRGFDSLPRHSRVTCPADRSRFAPEQFRSGRTEPVFDGRVTWTDPRTFL